MYRVPCRALAFVAALLMLALWIAARPVAASGNAQATLRLQRDVQRATLMWQTEAARTRLAAPGRASLLLSPFGPVASAPVDVEPPVQTLTRAQAQLADEQLGGDAVWIVHGCCGHDDTETSRGVVHGVMAAKNLPADAPVFIEAATPALAAHLAQRLAQDGLVQVFVVIH
jgi:hypothetical protein